MTTTEKTEKTEKTAPDTEQGVTSVTLTSERRVTWGYVRKKDLKPTTGNFENEEVSLYISDMVPEDVTNIVEWVQRHSEPVFDELKVQVWGSLDLPFGFSEAGRPVLDVPHASGTTPPPGVPPPQAQPQAPSPNPDPRQPARIAPGTPPPTPPPPHNPVAAEQKRMDPPTMAQVGVYAAQPAFCGETYKGGCGSREFYDNRTDVDAKLMEGKKATPDWKCKNCGKGVFRPGTFDYNKSVDARAASSTTAPPF